FGEETDSKLFLWGDSHAQMLLPVLDIACRELGVAGMASTRGGAAPVLDWSSHPAGTGANKADTSSAKLTMDEIRRLKEKEELAAVILAFRWGYYIEGEDFHPPWGLKNQSPFSEALLATIEQLRSMKLQVLVVQEVPIFDQHVPKTMALHVWRGVAKPRLSMDRVEEKRAPYDKLIASLAEMGLGVELFDPTPDFLGDGSWVRYLDENGVLLYRDEHHLTWQGSLRLEHRIKKQLATILFEANKR
ncbi:SGNH hydrolase domain-containing protein, partial [Akkermansiaceae bacterium]|nr:SGNH hydrolase domain-containing protein [Akkermansiaceae bacterium]